MQIVSYDGHNINDGTNYSTTLITRPRLPQTKAQLVKRTGRWPLVSGLKRPGVKLTLQIIVGDNDPEGLLDDLCRWFDPEDETPKKLVVEDDDGSNDRYVYAICEALQPSQKRHIQIATLAVHGDVRWRSTTETTDEWNITASGQTHVVANVGTDDAYPALKIKPTAGKGGYAYKRWIPIRWRVSSAANNYPVDICNADLDTAALVTAGKMQADGDDLRVHVDGVETDRWLSGMNSANTKVWVNLNWQAQQEATLAAGILAGDTVETLDVNEDISGFPSSGVLMIDSEAFVYTGKNNSLKRFTGVIRAAKGTAADDHDAGADVWWVQHDIWILYGNASATAPSVNDDYKPAFRLPVSSNSGWAYLFNEDDGSCWGEDDGLRAGAWAWMWVDGESQFKTIPRDPGHSSDPWEGVGISVCENGDYGAGRVYLSNVCGITSISIPEGVARAYSPLSAWDARIQSKMPTGSWTDEYSIPAPSSPGTWEQWSRNETLQSGATSVGLYLYEPSDGPGAEQIIYLSDDSSELGDEVYVYLNSSYIPVLIIGDEQGNYSLECTITNETTGDAITLDFTMELNEDLEVDTDAKTVTYLKDGSRQLQALELIGGARRDWLRLLPGNNTLKFEDPGTAGVTVTITFEERWY